MNVHKLPIWLLALLIALLVAGCTSAQNAPTSAPTQAEPAVTAAPTAESAPAAQTEAVPATGQEPTALLELPIDEATELPPSGQNDAESIEFVLVPEQSEARYRVREQLANLSLPNDAVGATNQISGGIVIHADGSLDPASRFVVDLSSMQSDQSRRDNFLRQNVLQTDQYPEAVFVPTRVSGLTLPLPENGEFTFQLTGDLTLRDVTRETTWDVSGSMQAGTAEGQARTSFTFADFNLTQPRVPIVLSIEDNIILEVDGVIRQESGVLPDTGRSEPAGEAQAVMPAPECSAPASLTPPMTEGPYYTANAPERNSLIEPGMPGTKLVLSGYVLNADCQPVANALLDFWQADSQGQYDNAGYVLRGRQYTDAAGRYHLETVLPGPYPGRTPHIHVKVQVPGGPLLVSQVFFPGDAQNQTDRIFDQHLLVTIAESHTDPLQAEYNFIVSNP